MSYQLVVGEYFCVICSKLLIVKMDLPGVTLSEVFTTPSEDQMAIPHA